MKRVDRGILLALLASAATVRVQAAEHIVRNPLEFAVTREAVTVGVADVVPQVLADAGSGAPLPTQMDVRPDGTAELIALLDLAPGERRRIAIQSGKPLPSACETFMATNAAGWSRRLTNDLIGCTVTLRASGPAVHKGLYQVWLTDFTVAGVATSGIQAVQNTQLALFDGPPEVRLWGGPLRTRIELQGAAQLWYSIHTNVHGRASLALTLNAGSPRLDLETRFDPSGSGELYLCSAGQLAVNTAGALWQLTAPPWKGSELAAIEFGGTNRVSDVMGTRRVAGIGPGQYFSYVHDDLNSSVAGVPGAGGRLRSQIAFRLSNFSARSNYIRPDLFRLRPKAGVAETLRLRLTLQAGAPSDSDFAERDYRRFQTDFMAPRRVRDAAPFNGRVAISAADRVRLGELVRERDVALVAGDAATEAGLAAVQRLAVKWQVPLLTAADLDTFLSREYPRSDCRDLLLVLTGSPEENRIVLANNARHGFVDAYYPGPGRGRIAIIEDFLGAGRPVVYAGGDDPDGGVQALETLGAEYAPPRVDAPQFRPLSTALRARPWMRRSRPDGIVLHTARGATASAHVLVFTPEALQDVSLTAELRHESGAVLTGAVAHIAWSFAAVGPGGEVYPEGREAIHPDGHPLPQATPYPGSVRPTGAPAPFVSHLANNDALWPGLPQRWPAGRLTSLWVNFAVGSGTPPGIHQGRLSVAWRGGRHETPVRLEVAPAILPVSWQMDFNAMYSLYGYNENMIRLYLGLPPHDGAAYLRAIEDLGALLESHGATIAQLSAYELAARLRPDGTVRLDTRLLDNTIDAYRRGGFSGQFIMSLTPNLWNGIDALLARHAAAGDSAEPRARLHGQLRAWMAGRGLEGRMIARAGDEPGDIEAWVRLAAPLKDSGFRLTVCHNRTQEAQMRQMIGTIEVWCPLWNGAITGWRGETRPDDDPACFNRSFFNERRAAGETIWNYTCATPYASLTRLPTELTFYLWDSFGKGFDGAAYYGGAYWSHQWGGDDLPGVRGHLAHRDFHVFDVFARCGWSGGTALIYPDARNRRLLSSQRWELLRQAQEDLKLLDRYRERHGEQALRLLLAPVVSPRDHDNIPPEEFEAVRAAALAGL